MSNVGQSRSNRFTHITDLPGINSWVYIDRVIGKAIIYQHIYLEVEEKKMRIVIIKRVPIVMFDWPNGGSCRLINTFLPNEWESSNNANRVISKDYDNEIC